MSLIGIFDNNLFTFTVSTLTFFLSQFLKDGNAVFFSVMIFFINSTFILSFGINIYFMVLGSVVFWILEFCPSIWFGNFCFLVFSVLLQVQGSH